MVLSDRAQFDLAMRLRSGSGVAIGEVFAFVSGLYFKGKLAYALEFARPPEPGAPLTGSGALVITPTAGLRGVETRNHHRRLAGFCRGRYRGRRSAIQKAAARERSRTG